MKWSEIVDLVENYPCDWPEARVGDWALERVSVSLREAQLFNLQNMVAGHRSRNIQPGTYTRLVHERRYQVAGGPARSTKAVWMSNTPAERRDHLSPVWEAATRGGEVLVNGLGLGFVAGCLLELKNVRQVTVVEIDPDVVTLVRPYLDQKYGTDRLTIEVEDAFEYRPPKGARYSVVWHDIWLAICGDHTGQMTRLHRKYATRCDWQGSWCRGLMRALDGKR